jgi:2-dehydropantoate 2-reductase
MKALKIAVVGAGGVGGYIAAKLTQHAVCVTLFARGKHLEAIRKRGLQVIEPDDAFTVFPDTDPPSEGEVFDVVFLAVKAYDFADACETIAPFTDENSLIIPLANGVGHRQVLERYLPGRHICEGCLYIVSHLQEPGVIRKKTALFYLIFGGCGVEEQMERVADLLNKCGLKTKLTPDATYACWKKYLFIAVFATLTSYYKMGMAEVFATHRKEVEQLLFETKAVANAMGVPITDADVANAIKQAENLPPNAKTSMQLDFEAGKKTELESLSGYIVRQGEKHGVAVDLMRKIYEALKR